MSHGTGTPQRWEARLTLNYLLSRPADGARIARARTVQVAVDARSSELQFALPGDFVAVVQAAPVAFDVERTLQKLGDLTADAARRGAHLALLL